MKPLPSNLAAFFPRESRLFSELEAEEVRAPQLIDWNSLEHELFVAFRVHGDLKGYIFVHCLDQKDNGQDLYEQTTNIGDVTQLLVRQFLDNLSDQLDLNIHLDQPLICPATRNFSNDQATSPGVRMLDFQERQRLIESFSRFQKLHRNNALQFEKNFLFRMKDLEFKMFFCLTFGNISELNH